MRLLWILSLGFIGLELLLFYRTQISPSPPSTALSLASSTQPPSPQSPNPVRPTIRHQVYSLPQAEVHTLVIPAQYQVIPAIADGVATLNNFAESHQAIAVINGGFFDPANQQSTSYLVIDGQLAADPQTNDRLTNNPDLAPYLDQIFNRSEFRQYRCFDSQSNAATTRYDIGLHRDAVPPNCELIHALGAGPRLLPELNLQPESFLEEANGAIVRDPINQGQLSPRSAIGITPRGDLIWVMVAQKPDMPDASGMTLQQLADFLRSLGAEKALNLDGGSSSAIYYDGKTYYGKLDPQGNPIERPVKSVLLVK